MQDNVEDLDPRLMYLFMAYYNNSANEQEIDELFQILASSIINDLTLIRLMAYAWKNTSAKYDIFTFEKSNKILENIIRKTLPEP